MSWKSQKSESDLIGLKSKMSSANKKSLFQVSSANDLSIHAVIPSGPADEWSFICLRSALIHLGVQSAQFISLQTSSADVVVESLKQEEK